MANQLFLIIEFLDELVFGVMEAAKPFLRNDLSLTYTQIGLLVFIPNLASSLIEPVLGILGDIWHRGKLIIAGGVFFGFALLLTSFSKQFWFLLFSFIVFFPASGAFVTLSQATLMDSDPNRRNQNMARWTFAGSLGVVLGPLLLGGFILAGSNWRNLFLVMSILPFVVIGTISFSKLKINKAIDLNEKRLTLVGFGAGFLEALKTLRNKEVVRWLVLLEFSDLMLDVLLGFLALYFVDVAGFSSKMAVLAVAIWTGVGLLGDFVLIPLLDRMDGIWYLKISVILELILFPAFLLIQWGWIKLIVLGWLGFFNSGWYAILKGELYSAMPGRSGAVMTIGNLAGLLGKLIPLIIGLMADRFGLGNAMWILLAGPLALLFGLPKRKTYTYDN
jgi:FSR family fosmidomycin resistance protein-like MFS transporter